MSELVERLLAQAERFAESGAVPVRPRLSATVLLLRPVTTGRQVRHGPDARSTRTGQAGFEVYLQRRVTSMAFASGMYVFPGGTVDPADYGAPVAGAGWAVRLGLPEREAWAVLRAAVRELAEETGVRVTAADLVPWSRWITPEFEPRRYDTSFFLAALPAGQQPANVSGEADRTEWLRPAEAVASCRSGAIVMLPPTLVTMRELAAYDSLDAALAAAADRDTANPIQPGVDDLRQLGDNLYGDDDLPASLSRNSGASGGP